MLPLTQHRTISVNGLTLFYREAGPVDAPPLILLHGFPSSSHMFRELLPRLADRYHLIAPDYPGFGYSDAPAPDAFEYSFDHLADVTQAFLDAMGLTRYSLYLQDYGGPVGFRLATRHPERIEALILQNANAYTEGLSELFLQTLQPLWQSRTSATEAPVLRSFSPEGIRDQYLTGARHPESLNPDAWTHDQARLARPGNAAIQLELQATYYTNLARYGEWHEYLRTARPPVLVTWGQGDPLFTVAGVERLQQGVPDAEVHFLDTGHFALEEDVELIAQLIANFLERVLVTEPR
ncbi:alpha/beta hydrolase [Deinococcus sp. HMF7604]|uniref:alpha/beta fold hydrolase n=1 Tax=Deinococcus betulae TaxID=2873312 RepID=UPI001CCB9C30|nr:alpha/beta hydrolase [Deinococcus betulae]MBZ9751130.1 alpha/beta hydrolase [Deinococcus betulae]